MFTVTEFTLLHQRIQSRAKPCFPTLSPKSASINPINPIRSSVCVCALSCSVMSDSVTPWIVACQSPLTMRFHQQEYLSGLLFPPPRGLPDPGIERMSLASPALVGGFLTTVPPGKS